MWRGLGLWYSDMDNDSLHPWIRPSLGRLSFALASRFPGPTDFDSEGNLKGMQGIYQGSSGPSEPVDLICPSLGSNIDSLLLARPAQQPPKPNPGRQSEPRNATPVAQARVPERPPLFRSCPPAFTPIN